jgi:hypothetical protein
MKLDVCLCSPESLAKAMNSSKMCLKQDRRNKRNFFKIMISKINIPALAPICLDYRKIYNHPLLTLKSPFVKSVSNHMPVKFVLVIPCFKPWYHSRGRGGNHWKFCRKIVQFVHLPPRQKKVIFRGKWPCWSNCTLHIVNQRKCN